MNDLEQILDLLTLSKHAITLTGAGISTPSGIPDFRTPGSGLWESVDPFTVASLEGFRRKPAIFYRWIRPMIRLMQQAIPNPAHMALAQLERLGQIKAVITQNIDGLHTRAGSEKVIELHGHFRTATCISCYRQLAGDRLLTALVASDQVPTCNQCGGILKPDIILMGEQLPYSVSQNAIDETKSCDLMIVAGSSLVVEPAASLPLLAQECGARIIVVNLEPTHIDNLADVVIHDDVAVILPRLIGKK